MNSSSAGRIGPAGLAGAAVPIRQPLPPPELLPDADLPDGGAGGTESAPWIAAYSAAVSDLNRPEVLEPALAEPVGAGGMLSVTGPAVRFRIQ